VDLYRIGHPDEVLEIGLEEILADTGIVAIEWAERIDDLLPADRVASTSPPGPAMSGTSWSATGAQPQKGSLRQFAKTGGEQVKWH